MNNNHERGRLLIELLILTIRKQKTIFQIKTTNIEKLNKDTHNFLSFLFALIFLKYLSSFFQILLMTGLLYSKSFFNC